MITVVSGLPRSGTSMMMQMLRAGGMPILADPEVNEYGQKNSNIHNPKGYWEWKPILEIYRFNEAGEYRSVLHREPTLIDAAEGKAVKVISAFGPPALLSLPLDRAYQIIFMERKFDEVFASLMSFMNYTYSNVDTAPLKREFQQQLSDMNDWLTRSGVRVLRVHYNRVLKEPVTVAEEIAEFLGAPLDIEAMVGQVDESLYRNRA